MDKKIEIVKAVEADLKDTPIVPEAKEVLEEPKVVAVEEVAAEVVEEVVKENEEVVEEPKKEVAIEMGVVEEPKVLTIEDYIAAAPEEFKSILEAGLVAHRAERAKLIDGLMTNKSNVFTEIELQDKSNTELGKLTALAATVTPVKDYSANVGAPVAINKKEELALMPEMQWESK